jgi:hypothetical protein
VSSNPPSLIPALQKIAIVYLHSYFLLDRRFISSNKTKTWLSSDSIQYFCAWCTYISFINNNADMTLGYWGNVMVFYPRYGLILSNIQRNWFAISSDAWRARKVLQFNFEELIHTLDKRPSHSHCYQVNDCQVT